MLNTHRRMQRLVFFMATIATLTAFSAKAQNEDAAPKAQKAPREIIIKKGKSGENGKTVIVIDGDKVTVNGKPSDQWDDGSVVIIPDMGPDMARLGKKMKEMKEMKFNFYTDRMALGEKVRLGVYTKENEKGAEVVRVSDSSAAFKAGLKEGDIITKVNDSPISDPEALSKAIHSHEPNEQVTIAYIRSGTESTAKVTLEKPKELVIKNLMFRPGMELKMDGFRDFKRRPRLGANIQDTEDNSGVKVIQVNPESPAAKAGLQKDDVITSISGQKVTDVNGAMDVLNDNEDKNNYTIVVNRAGSTVTLEVKIPKELHTGSL